MERIMLKDIIKRPYENWNYYKYEDYNNCPHCNGKIKMIGSVNEYQKFKCLECRQVFTLNAIAENIKIE